MVWIAGAAAVALLVAIAFLVFQLAGGGGGGGGSPSPSASPSASAVPVPNFVDMLLVDAQRQADELGIILVSTGQASDKPVGTILAQDPPAGTPLVPGDTVNITVATGPDTVAVPNVRTLPENEALQAIVAAGLTRRHADRGVRPDDRGGLGRLAGADAGADRRARHPGRLRRLEGARTDADAVAHADAHADPDTDADPDTHADPDTDADADPDTDTEVTPTPTPAP